MCLYLDFKPFYSLLVTSNRIPFSLTCLLNVSVNGLMCKAVYFISLFFLFLLSYSFYPSSCLLLFLFLLPIFSLLFFIHYSYCPSFYPSFLSFLLFILILIAYPSILPSLHSSCLLFIIILIAHPSTLPFLHSFSCLLLSLFLFCLFLGISYLPVYLIFFVIIF